MNTRPQAGHSFSDVANRPFRPQCVSSVALQLAHTIRRFSSRLSSCTPLTLSRISDIRRPCQISPLAAELAGPRLEPFPEEPLFQQRSLVRRAFDEDGGERDLHEAKPGLSRRIGIDLVHRDAKNLL